MNVALQRVSVCILNLPRHFLHRPIELTLELTDCCARARDFGTAVCECLHFEPSAAFPPSPRWNVTRGFDSRESSPPATHKYGDGQHFSGALLEVASLTCPLLAVLLQLSWRHPANQLVQWRHLCVPQCEHSHFELSMTFPQLPHWGGLFEHSLNFHPSPLWSLTSISRLAGRWCLCPFRRSGEL